MLGPGEEPFPKDEIYEVECFPRLLEMSRSGQPYFHAIDDPDCAPASRAFLQSLGKTSDLGVAIVMEGEIWGGVWATTTAGSPAFRSEDVRFLEAIGGQLATAITRAELFSKVSRLAYEDPLTGLANRRALEERLDRSLARFASKETSVALLLTDVDRLKAINDAGGHAAGDRSLRAVAKALVEASADYPGAFVARLAGDEFCVLLENRVRHGSAGEQGAAEVLSAMELLGASVQRSLADVARSGSGSPPRRSGIGIRRRPDRRRLERHRPLRASRPRLRGDRGGALGRARGQGLLHRRAFPFDRRERRGDRPPARDEGRGAANAPLRRRLPRHRQALAVSRELLSKPGPLTAEEWSEIAQHTLVGEQILAPIEFLAPIRPLVRHAHERWDGEGYPDGLAGEAIPLGARILFVCDAYDAMTTDRSYRTAMSAEEAREDLRRCSGAQFDPAVVDALIAVLGADGSHPRRTVRARAGSGSAVPDGP